MFRFLTDSLTAAAVYDAGIRISAETVTHGGMYLLGKEDTRDNLIRIQDEDVAAELLVKVLGKDET